MDTPQNSGQTATIITFPFARRDNLKTCPHCGTVTDVWRFGRLLWAYCDEHQIRWVARDFHETIPLAQDRRQLRRSLEFLSSFVEVSR